MDLVVGRRADAALDCPEERKKQKFGNPKVKERVLLLHAGTDHLRGLRAKGSKVTLCLLAPSLTRPLLQLARHDASKNALNSDTNDTLAQNPVRDLAFALPFILT